MGARENWNIWEDEAGSAPGLRGWLWRGLLTIFVVTLLLVATGCGPTGWGPRHDRHRPWGHERSDLEDVEVLKDHAASALDPGLGTFDTDPGHRLR